MTADPRQPAGTAPRPRTGLEHALQAKVRRQAGTSPQTGLDPAGTARANKQAGIPPPRSPKTTPQAWPGGTAAVRRPSPFIRGQAYASENPSPSSQPHYRLRTSLRRATPLLGAGLLAFLGAVIYRGLYPPEPPLTPRQVDEIAAERLASATAAPAYSAQVYQVILPSLVVIQTHGHASDDPEGVGVGTGVVVNTDGDILTALHVVAGASEIELLFADGSQAKGEVITAQPENDIAVLHPLTPPELIVPAVLGGGARVGDEAYAVGNPLGLVASMSSGVISGLNRSYDMQNGAHLEGLIQFDAAVNPGNSGGPLLNRAGQVIGIVTALANSSDGGDFFIGIGFAVPIAAAGGVAGAPDY